MKSACVIGILIQIPLFPSCCHMSRDLINLLLNESELTISIKCLGLTVTPLKLHGSMKFHFKALSLNMTSKLLHFVKKHWF